MTASQYSGSNCGSSNSSNNNSVDNNLGNSNDNSDGTEATGREQRQSDYNEKAATSGTHPVVVVSY